MPPPPNQSEVIQDLLEDATRLDVVKEFLKEKQLTFSAPSWKEMREKRLQPYLDSGQVTIAELQHLLTSAEECGAQHIFLYQCERATAARLIDRAYAENVLRRRGLGALLTAPDIQSMPDAPTIVDVRWGTAGVDNSLTVKEVETRVKRVFMREMARNNRYFKVYTNEKVRAVNVAKLHLDGLLEIRIASRNNTSKYDDDLRRFRAQVQDFFPLGEFWEVSLGTAKDKLWAQRNELVDLIRYTDASVCGEDGNVLHAYTGSHRSNLSNSKAGDAVDRLMDEDANAYCSESNLWFVKSERLSAPIHVLLNGEVNELALTAKCSAADYDYVLNQIRHFNR